MSTTHNPNLRVWGYGYDFSDPDHEVKHGDSGSPICRKKNLLTVPPVPGRVPIGIQNAESFSVPNSQETHDVYLASVHWALNNSGGWEDLEIYRGGWGSVAVAP